MGLLQSCFARTGTWLHAGRYLCALVSDLPKRNGWTIAEQVADPATALVTGLPPDLLFRTKGQLAIDVLDDAHADGFKFDFICGDEVYGSCTVLRESLQDRGQPYVLRVASSFILVLAGQKASCTATVTRLVKDRRRWEISSAGTGSKGERCYAWAWIATDRPRHHLLVRRHLRSGELPTCLGSPSLLSDRDL